MLHALAKLFSIAPGEGRKTALLYSLHLVFYLGLMWGDAARETLFLSAWSADDLALVFVAYAVLGFIIGLAYAFVADRISNGLLLKIIMGVMIVWLVSVRILLETNGGPRGAVYPYFYLAYSAFRDLATMHILTYINDFYDTRAAKRALPLMLSAGIAGGTLAGFTTSLLNRLFGLENTPLIWAVCLAGCFILVMGIERRLRGDLEQIERRRQQAYSRKKTEKGGLQNLREGFEFVRRSGLMRALAIATFAMVVLMNLLIFQSSRVFAGEYANDPDGLFAFYGLLGGVSNMGGLLIQSLLLSRLVNWLGVGTMNLLFPFLTLGSVAAINAAPGMASGIFARLDTNMLKQTFRNPLDAMLYNSIPVNNKARARGFVNGVIVPAGTLSAGLIILAVKMQAFSMPMIVGIGLGTAILYVLVMFTVRREYAKALTSLLGGDELALFQQDASEAVPTDPATVKWLRQKLESLPAEPGADRQALFISQMLYDMDADAALPLMLDLAKRRGAVFRKGTIEFLAQAGVARVDFIRLCQRGLEDPEPMVRESAAAALLNYLNRDSVGRSAVIPEDSILNSLFHRLDDLPLDEQARLVVLLMRGGSPGQKSKARDLLDGWLAAADLDRPAGSENSAPVLEAALVVLAEAERQGLIARLHPANSLELQQLSNTQPNRFKDLTGRLVSHSDPFIRHQAIPALVRESRLAHWDEKHWSVQFLMRLLDDPEESIRLAVIEELADDAGDMPLKPVLWKALNDPALEIRRAACALNIHFDRGTLRALWDCLDDEEINRAESAIYLLRRAGQRGVSAALGRMADSLIRDAYWLTLQALALKQSGARPGTLLMAHALREDSLRIVDCLLWLLSASTSEEEIQAVKRALLSGDAAERANAAEALEANLSPAEARQLQHLLDGSPDETIIAVAAQELGLSQPAPAQALRAAWPQLDSENAAAAIPRRAQKFYNDGWLTAAAIHLLTEAHRLGRVEAEMSIPTETIRAALDATLQSDSRANVHETAERAWSELNSSAKDSPMSAEQPLTLIEKVIFLKEVPFFSELPFREISILAGISEEISYPAEHKIFSQGDTTKTLYLIVKGRVSVQQQQGRAGSIVRLATLGARNYFAETSLFDGAPHQADIVTIEPVDILLIRQSTLFALVRRRPDLGLSLLKSLSQRLRETYAQIAQSERAKPQKLVSLFDKLEG
ncbi:MAG: hypothetical protein DPW18_03170 [Chloroflexi bacterium]|nr:hypothetical protein [Chloroflexota bacterium]MDL1943023.1 cyclic nucleotide-binding domain-containing protein [Chloroflexi bacterium CFX2]